LDKLNQLSTPEKAVAGGGVLLLIASFLDWWHYSELGFSFGESAWGDPGSIWGILLVFVGIALAGIVLATKLGNMAMPQLPQGVTNGTLFGGGAALAVVLLLLKAWRIMDVPAGGFGIGFFLGVVAVAAIAYGGFMIYTAEKGSSPFGGTSRGA
jgi:hypothetical protein